MSSSSRVYKTKTRTILLVSVAICALFLSVWTFATQPKNTTELQESPNAIKGALEALQSVPARPWQITDDAVPLVQQICSNIYKGDFANARQLVGQSNEPNCTAISQLTDVISEYETIEQQRQSARETTYAERLAELEKFRAKTDTNDVNDIPTALSAIANICEFADKAQKDKLLSDALVKQVFQKAIDKAAEDESKGKWLNAYINCYYWLQAIDPNNEAYSEYAEQLLEKANIAASFQDSPCETRQQRYEGVKEEMFVRAIDALKFHYVSIIDYRQMATEAIKRCNLLAQVVSLLPSEETSSDQASEDSFSPPDSKKLAAWSAALAGILDEVKSPIGMSKDKFIDVFEKVLSLNTTTVQLPRGVLITQFVEAAFSALDPYTVLVWPRQVQDFEQIMTSEFTGIGIEISKPEGLLTVSSLLLDTPAFNCGVIDAGDIIEAVDDVETKDMTLTCAVKHIKGPAGTNVKLRIRRPLSKDRGQKTEKSDFKREDKVFDVTLTRAKITVPTIRGWQRTEQGRWLYMIDEKNKIGYVRITSFSAETPSTLEEVLAQLEGTQAEGLRGLILDLRFNSGGLLNSATAVADKFIKEGLIVSTRPRLAWTYISANKEDTHPNYPLVVLINSSSASGSEIVAGALADEQHNRAILVGERSHGKGSVQGITSYPGAGAQLKYTMAYYHLPSGQRVESQEAMKKQGRKDWGIGPDIEIKLRSDELRKLINTRRDNDVLVKADHTDGAIELKKHTAEETLAADPQLAVAVLVIKSKLIQESL